MGNKHSRGRDLASDLVPASIDVTQRETMATWFRTDIAVTNVYEIMEILGQGHLGEVYKVRRKVASRGLHNDETRNAGNAGYGAYNAMTGDKAVSSGASVSSYVSAPKAKKRFGLDLSRHSHAGLDLSRHSHAGDVSVASYGSGKGHRRRFRRKNKKKVIQDMLTDASSVHSAPVLKNPPSASLKPPKPILRAPSHGKKAAEVNEETKSQGDCDGCDPSNIFVLPKNLITTSPITPNGSSDEDDITLNTNNEDDSAISPPGTFANIIDPCISQGEMSLEQTPVTSPSSNSSVNDSTGSNSSTSDSDGEEKQEYDDIKPPPISSLASPANSEATKQTRNVRQSSDGSVRILRTPKWEGKVSDKAEYVPRRQVRFQRLYACKTVMTNQVKKDQLDELLNEIHIMRSLDHPFIIRLYEVYQVKRKLWLVMDLCTGGNLTSRKLNEAEVTVVLEQILRGVAYLHRLGICHRDLKLENILYESGSASSTIRLIDFGMSQKYDTLRDKKEREFGGAAYTLSPEIASKSGPYTKKSDVWSIGVIVWKLLAGDFPFLKTWEDLEDEQKKQKLIQAQHQFGITWRGRGISEHAKEFVRSCLHRDPNDRWTASEALEFLQETWIPSLQEQATKEDERIAAIVNASPKKNGKKTIIKKAPDDPTTVLKKAIVSKRRTNDKFEINLDGVKKFSQYGQLKKTFLITMANTMDRQEAGALRELFLYVDTTHSGTITWEEFKDAMERVEGANADEQEIKELFSAIDHDQSGQIHYNEFVAANLESQGLINMDRLADVFDRIDTTGKGYISKDDLKAILGQNYSKEVVDTMIEEADFKKNGQIDYDEFLQLMFEGEFNRDARDGLKPRLKAS